MAKTTKNTDLLKQPVQDHLHIPGLIKNIIDHHGVDLLHHFQHLGVAHRRVAALVDQGVLGEKYVGKTIGQRTVLTVQDADRHTMEIYFTPPGERERLIDRKKYTRVK
jgi:hypothetical protein